MPVKLEWLGYRMLWLLLSRFHTIPACPDRRTDWRTDGLYLIKLVWTLDSVSTWFYRRRQRPSAMHICRLSAHNGLAVETPTRYLRWQEAGVEVWAWSTYSHTWVQQIEADIGLSPDAAWKAAVDRHAWRALRRVVGQEDWWMNGCDCVIAQQLTISLKLQT